MQIILYLALNSDKDKTELVTNVDASGVDTDTFLAAYSGKDGKEGNGVEESNCMIN